MKMKVDRILIITTMVCLLPLILSMALYDRLPDTVAIHWNFEGNADGYASKSFAAFGLPFIMVFINLITHLALNSDPKKSNSSVVLLNVGKWTTPVLTLALVPITLFKSMGSDINISTIVPAFIGLLFIVIGNYLPKCKQNYTVGIKLPWTLNNEVNWNKTHHIAGYLWIIGGTLMFINSFIGFHWKWIFAITISALVLVPAVYSYMLYKKGY